VTDAGEPGTDTAASVGGPGWPGRAERAGRRLARVVVGDRLGALVLLGALTVFVPLWRVDVVLNDSLVMANTFANVAEGRLAVTETPYSSLALDSARLPGFLEVDGVRYGRNYGHLFAALPLLWALRGLSALADPRVLLAGLWSLLVLGTAVLAARELDRPWLRTVGAVLAVVLLAGNLATAVDLGRDQLPLVALQASTMFAAALAATLVYRLVARVEGRPTGVAAGVALALATPLGFWASFPKRHAVSVAVVAAVLYCFLLGREPGRRGFRARLAMYALVGLHATVHSREATFLLLVVAPLDLLSAPSNSRRRLAAAAGVFLLSALPFLILNTAISGNPVAPPRALLSGAADIQPPDLGDPGAADGGGGGADGSGGADGGGGGADGPGGPGPLARLVGLVRGLLAPVLGLVGPVAGIADQVYTPLARGVGTLSAPDRLYHTFLRSGTIPGVRYGPGLVGTELALLESLPLAGALLGGGAAGLSGLRRLGTRPRTPTGWTDLLAAVLLAVLALVQIQRLPLHAQLGPRYLLPLVVPLVYGLARLPAVSGAVRDRPRWLAGAYAVTALVGGLVLVAVLAALTPARGEAMQFHALAALASAAVGALAVGTHRLHGDPRAVAAGLALPAGATTAFLVLAALAYFPPSGGATSGTYALGLTRVAATLVPVL